MSAPELTPEEQAWEDRQDAVAGATQRSLDRSDTLDFPAIVVDARATAPELFAGLADHELHALAFMVLESDWIEPAIALMQLQTVARWAKVGTEDLHGVIARMVALGMPVDAAVLDSFEQWLDDFAIRMQAREAEANAAMTASWAAINHAKGAAA
jgi:hypothetical protein